MNMKKGIHMSKDALRAVAAAGVLSVVLGLGACSMPGSGNAGASDGGSSSSSSSSGSSSYEAELKQALQSASSDFERGVLERAVKAGRISESDYREFCASTPVGAYGVIDVSTRSTGTSPWPPITMSMKLSGYTPTSSSAPPAIAGSLIRALPDTG